MSNGRTLKAFGGDRFIIFSYRELMPIGTPIIPKKFVHLDNVPPYGFGARCVVWEETEQRHYIVSQVCLLDFYEN